ncbi:hypothetical protein P280DRAFT_539923 [Massarina eburnea CBS 473.64]|uniref:Uncharacterized protein n=1 Tax=Massarina eburnea CBS 473.64 TaxID=1395130 RepID=A0A6A6RGS0_9PLEO|nr:hypothetical protein P280DRAFT_539923 [Massarina eburnea CBS 473.64]
MSDNKRDPPFGEHYQSLARRAQTPGVTSPQSEATEKEPFRPSNLALSRYATSKEPKKVFNKPPTSTDANSSPTPVAGQTTNKITEVTPDYMHGLLNRLVPDSGPVHAISSAKPPAQYSAMPSPSAPESSQSRQEVPPKHSKALVQSQAYEGQTINIESQQGSENQKTNELIRRWQAEPHDAVEWGLHYAKIEKAHTDKRIENLEREVGTLKVTLGEKNAEIESLRGEKERDSQILEWAAKLIKTIDFRQIAELIKHMNLDGD